MSKEKAEIPILGLDTRPLQRQAVAGLCSDIKNLRPDGMKEDPYWRAVPEPGQLKNSSGVAFSHSKQGLIVDAYYLVQNRNVPGGQTERLILVFSDGSLDVVDPDGTGDWQVITTYDFEEEAGPWSADFAVVGEILAIAISQGEFPYQLLYLYQDQVIPYGFPDLPNLSMNKIPKGYSDVQVEAGTHTGLRDGYYAYRYGFRIAPGKNVMLSPPIPFEVNRDEAGDDYNEYDHVFFELEFTLVGYSAENPPQNYSFWRKVLGGIDVYVSDRHESKADVLLDGLFYNVVSFGSIDKQLDYVGSQDPNIKRFAGKEEDISTNPLFDVDDGSFHRLAASTVHGYNSRLALGRVAVDFAEPPVSIYGFVADPDDWINMSPVEITFVPNHNLTVFNWRLQFTLTALQGSVLPASEVSVDNIMTDSNPANLDGAPGITQINDQVVEVRIQILTGNNLNHVFSFDVTAQTYSDMDKTEPVGEEFNRHWERE